MLRPPELETLGKWERKKQESKLNWFKKLTRRVVLMLAKVNSKTKRNVPEQILLFIYDEFDKYSLSVISAFMVLEGVSLK